MALILSVRKWTPRRVTFELGGEYARLRGLIVRFFLNISWCLRLYDFTFELTFVTNLTILSTD